MEAGQCVTVESTRSKSSESRIFPIPLLYVAAWVIPDLPSVFFAINSEHNSSLTNFGCYEGWPVTVHVCRDGRAEDGRAPEGEVVIYTPLSRTSVAFCI